MAITTYPLNNQSYDASGAELFHCTRTSGVWAGDEDFNIGDVSGSDNNIPVLPGLAWIRNATFSGKVVAQKTPVTLNLGLPDPTYPRIDAIVLQFSANKNATELIVKKGSASSAAVPPERIQTEAVYELHLYHVLRKPSAVAITRDDITDLRDDEKWCGIMYDDVTLKGTLGFLTQKDKDVSGGVAGLNSERKLLKEVIPFTVQEFEAKISVRSGPASLFGSPSARVTNIEKTKLIYAKCYLNEGSSGRSFISIGPLNEKYPPIGGIGILFISYKDNHSKTLAIKSECFNGDGTNTIHFVAEIPQGTDRIDAFGVI